MNKKNITRGPVKWDTQEGESAILATDTEHVSIVLQTPWGYWATKDDRELIAQAFNTLHEAGYTPAELAEQVRELREALKMFVEGPLIRTVAERSADLQAATDKAAAILAKYQPVTP